MLGEDSMRAMKMLFCLEWLEARRGKTISNVETILILKHFYGGQEAHARL